MRTGFGALAQLGERLICIQEVIGSIPIGSTMTAHDHQGHLLVCLIVLCGRRLTSLRERNISIVWRPAYGMAWGFDPRETILFQV